MLTAINGNLIVALVFLVGMQAQNKHLMLGALIAACASWCVNWADEAEWKYPRGPAVAVIVCFTVALLAIATLLLL